jgi:uncharacterized protein YbbK (DUF523 family)
MRKVLISACLIGERVRYDGKAKTCNDAILKQWLAQGRVVPICPEVAGGLPVPRQPAEISGGRGEDVLNNCADVISRNGQITTEAFIAGARLTGDLLRKTDAVLAVLKDGSPSCGSNYIYDGTFSGRRIPGNGVTAALLKQQGVKVFSEKEIEKTAGYLRSTDGGRR